MSAGVFHVAISRDGRLGIAAQMRPKNLIPLAHVEHGWVFGNSLAVFGEDVGRRGAAAAGRDRTLLLAAVRRGDRAGQIEGLLISAAGSNEDRHRRSAKLLVCRALARSATRWPTIFRPRRATWWRAFRWAAIREAYRALAGWRRLYVANRLDDTISVLDTAADGDRQPLRWAGRPSSRAERRGERLFYSPKFALPATQFGCANCHLDSTIDGLHWDLEPDGFGVDIVDNRSLEDVSRNRALQVERRQSGPPNRVRPAHRALLLPVARIPRQDDLDDLVAYVKSIPLRPNRYRLPDGELTPAQERGKAIFERTVAKTATPIPELNQCFVLPLRAVLHQPATGRCRHRQVHRPLAADRHSAADQRGLQRALSARRFGAHAGRDLDRFQSERHARGHQRPGQR